MGSKTIQHYNRQQCGLRLLNFLKFSASEGEDVFAVTHIFASFNDTFVHITDLSGK